MSALVSQPCRSLCWWADTGTEHEALPMFACAGCGSQWVRSEPWRPMQADGSWPDGVREQVQQRSVERPGGR